MQHQEDPLAEFIAAGLVTAPTDSDDPQDSPIHDDDDPQDPLADKDEPQDEPDPIIKSYYEYLTEKGLIDIPEDLEFNGTEEQLEEIFEHTKTVQQQQVVQKLWDNLPPDFKGVLEYALSGGSSLEDYVKAFSAQDVTKLDLSSPDNQKKLLREYYKETTAFSDDKINKLIASIEEDDALAEEVTEAAEKLQDIRQRRKQQMAQQAAQQEAANKKAVELRTQKLVEAIETSPNIHPTRRQKVRTFFFSPLKTEQGQSTAFNETIKNIMDNPEHQAQLADILLDYDKEKGLLLDRLEKRAKTKGVAQLRDRLSKAVDPKHQNTPVRTNKSDSQDFLSKWLSAN